MRKKKSQIAMETILIYGVAILIVSSAVGYLYYSDTLNTSILLPNRCDISSVDLSCSEYSVIISESEKKSGIKIELQNNLKFDVIVNKLIIRGKADMTGMWSSNIKKCELTKKKKIYHEAIELVIIDNCDIKMPIGSKIKGIMNISYHGVDSNVIRTSFGEISTNVAEGCFGIEQEFCNNKDDNCNGLIDENLEKECSVTNQFGTCFGMEICNKGMWSSCNARIPALEECNGIDDDCDGKIDDGLEDCCECLVVGSCQAGARGYVCNGCHYVEAPEEVCDGIDNDCDNNIDEGFDQDDCKEKCTHIWTGNSGNLNCCGDDPLEGPYGEEICDDGRDNNCDGECDYAGCNGITHGDINCKVAIDKNCEREVALGMISLCENQLGVCKGSVKICGGDLGWLDCDASNYQENNPYYEPIETSCGDNLDNDCDGLNDCIDLDCEGKTCDTGKICQSGSCEIPCECSGTSCEPGNTGRVCDGCSYITAPTEICNDLIDNNCDGNIDCADNNCVSTYPYCCDNTCIFNNPRRGTHGYPVIYMVGYTEYPQHAQRICAEAGYTTTSSISSYSCTDETTYYSYWDGSAWQESYTGKWGCKLVSQVVCTGK